MQTTSLRSLSALAVFLCLLLFSTPARAQLALPDSPEMIAALDQVSSSGPGAQVATSAQEGQQTKRILGIVPNFRAVSANTHLPPQTVKDKFTTASQDSFDYSAVIFSALVAGASMAAAQTPEFGEGASGYGRYFWHTFVDQTIENYMVEFIVPAAHHEDTRYYTLGSDGGANSFVKRTEYALSRVVVTRSDSGTHTFNAGEVIGAGAAAGLSNLYYPSKERSFGNTAQKWGVNIGLDAGTFVFKEFWPDINRTVFRAKQ